MYDKPPKNSVESTMNIYFFVYLKDQQLKAGQLCQPHLSSPILLKVSWGSLNLGWVSWGHLLCFRGTSGRTWSYSSHCSGRDARENKQNYAKLSKRYKRFLLWSLLQVFILLWKLLLTCKNLTNSVCFSPVHLSHVSLILRPKDSKEFFSPP